MSTSPKVKAQKLTHLIQRLSVMGERRRLGRVPLRVVGSALILLLSLLWETLLGPELEPELGAVLGNQAMAQEIPPSDSDIDRDPVTVESSPVLQRWKQDIPDVLLDIQTDPSFRTRLRTGYTQEWTHGDGGWSVGVEDWFIGTTGLTLNADYWTRLNHHEEQYGADLRYYVLPLGGTVNMAPVIGYRHVETDQFDTNGVNVGIRLLLVPARTGAADLSLTQTWVDPGSDRHSLSRFTLSAGYALTNRFRLSSDLQVQTTEDQSETTVGLLVEWML